MQTGELDGVLARWFERHGGCAAIVRPDHYVYGVARNEAVLSELLDGLAEAIGQVATA
jgi:3-(3-hydroxy-phenyl)propionate hydroxylase